MVSSVTSAVQAERADVYPAQAQSTSKVAADPKSQGSQPQSTASTVKDTVNISSAAKAALQEATETSAQTAQEARSGDLQAQRRLAKAEAARATEK
jgi:hypothetical protein